MASRVQSSFKCPTCSALYQVVKIDAGQGRTHREAACRDCGAPFPAREGRFILKYFMLRKAGRRQKWGQRKQRHKSRNLGL
jgi:DNA-directed RNA polymerase subunit RPC12/RpoP